MRSSFSRFSREEEPSPYPGQNFTTGTIKDDDTRGIAVLNGQIKTTEGATESYSVKLKSAPSAPATVNISTLPDTSTQPISFTFDKTSLAFNNSNWSSEQDVEIKVGHFTGPHDRLGVLFKIDHIAKGGDYEGESQYGWIIIEPKSGIGKSMLSLAENGGSQTYSIALATKPSGSVTVSITSSDSSVVSVSPSTLTFTKDNYNVPQNVTVTGVDDNVNSSRSATITHTFSGSFWMATIDKVAPGSGGASGSGAASVSVMVHDVDDGPTATLDITVGSD